ncbi:DUF1697 domain-containing protein [Aquimarina algiphila]|uniref:DUF1697 domain-containing protein n=1 Tax=Aquimarina algiphila TaxID=2047982 RepID=UPI0024924FC5|nr:DUF1697 domain-containing protein [Aquimarina algiphila]
MNQYVAFLRGINVSGYHKVPMIELREEMHKLNFKNVATILNSGNVIFDSINNDLKNLEKTISEHLEKVFGFPVPTIIRQSERIYRLLERNPFRDIVNTKDIRLYISFLRKDIQTELDFPWTNNDKSYTILEKSNKEIISILDLSIAKTPKGMEALERYFGKDITTRNWNTIKRIEKKLRADLN